MNLRVSRCGFACAVITVLGLSSAHGQGLPQATPESVGMDAQRLTGVGDLVHQGIQEGKMPGCVVCVGRHGQIVYLEAFGQRKLDKEPMTIDTLFDMASITKPVATATSIMKLIENGQLRLDEKVVTLFPEFAPNGKDEITIKDMLLHQSGLIPDNALSDYEHGPEIAWQNICELGLVAPVGKSFKYSDVNFIVLAEIIKKVSGKTVHEFSQTEIFQPLGMSESGYLPADTLRERAATTEKRNGQWMRGEVHDPRAFELGGVAGHAGLFSTARDLAIYAQMMLGEGTFHRGTQQVRILSPQTVATMTQAYHVSSGTRGLGWDKQSPYSSNRGDLLSSAAFGHGGFTGTVLWIDPGLDLFFIFLSNRVHPDGKGNVNPLAGKILNLVASCIDEKAHDIPVTAPILCGIDVLEQEHFRSLAGQRMGLITNHTGRNLVGKSTVEILHAATECSLTTLFSPEHGFEGTKDVAKISDSSDASTGLQIYSLYGETRQPTEAMLANVDTLVFDIQDIGARFYTYVSTMGEAMQSAAKYKKRFVVLDRPNPIGGVAIAGPMLDAGKESFVGFHHLPVRHAMTIGELAGMIRSERNLELDLQIVECQGWNRNTFWDATNLTWINPSPNMRSLTQAFLYPGIGLLETTNVSVGRGTDTPFEVLGAPWIDGRALAKNLNQRAIPGVTFVPIIFTPESSQYANQPCGGVNIAIVDRKEFEPLRVGLEIATQLRNMYPDQWETKNFNRLLGNDLVFASVVSGGSVNDSLKKALEGIAAFRQRRESFLLYR